MAKPIPVVMARLNTVREVLAQTLASMIEKREMGRLRRRSIRPRPRSSATPAEAPMPVNSTLVATNPGTRKST